MTELAAEPIAEKLAERGLLLKEIPLEKQAVN